MNKERINKIFATDQFGFRKFTVYQKALELEGELHLLSGKFPKGEIFGLTTQVRRSSKSICANIAEGYEKRMYPAHFKSKMTDADMENTGTQIWCDFAFACEYVDEEQHAKILKTSAEVGKMLNNMEANPEKFLPKNNKVETKKK